MNLFRAMLTTMALLATGPTEAQPVVITRGASRPARPAPAENFTGAVRVEMLFEALTRKWRRRHVRAGSRTAWHSHPRGQILIITAGAGRVQRWGDPIEEIRQGDVVRIPASEKHWGQRPRRP
jgi:4-carboxymuconolactone decarboxylase